MAVIGRTIVYEDDLMSELKIEGYTIPELKGLIGTEDFEFLIFSNKPVVLSAGSAELLAQFHKVENELHIDLVHIDGGGEGVLISINSLAKQYAIEKKYPVINWYVYATNCTRPNPKLQKILKLKEYEVKEVPNKGFVFYKQDQINLETTANNA